MIQQSALARHPELAQLWTLHHACRVGRLVIEQAHPVDPAPDILPAICQVDGAMVDLLLAIEEYMLAVEERPSGRYVVIPANCSGEQGRAVLDFLYAMAGSVWEATEHELLDEGASCRGGRRP